MSVSDTRKALYGHINAIKNKKCIPNDVYRGVLVELTGKDSLKEMSFDELKQVAAVIRQRDYVDYTGISPDVRKQWCLIQQLRRDLKWDDERMRKYIKHCVKLDHERFLTVPTARALITGLFKTLKYNRRKGK